METYINDIITGVYTFPLIAFLLTLPYMAIQYHRYGSISFWKSLLVYAFVFYLICAYFMVILPLPAEHKAAACGAVSVQPCLTPFRFVGDFAEAAEAVGLSVNPSTWAAFLKQGSVYTTLFNVLLTLPLGVFARYLLNMRWWQALMLGLCMTLFYEFSQLTGLWGIYDYAYRLFDVDDLIVNTFGCMLGFWIAVPLQHHLPDFDKINDRMIEKGENRASFTRRAIGFVVDLLLSIVLAVAVYVIASLNCGVAIADAVPIFFVTSGFFFILMPLFTRGQTLGHKVVRVCIKRRDGSPATRWHIFWRNALFVWVFLQAPGLFMYFVPAELYDGVIFAVAIAVLGIVYIVWALSLLIRAIRSAFKHSFVMLNGIISNTTITPVKRKIEHTDANDIQNASSSAHIEK